HLSQVVANHYNSLQEKGKDARKESRIFHLRNFNNWIKSVTIADILKRIRDEKGSDCDINVLDIGCGKGGDLLKYDKGNITHIICADIAETSVKQCEDRYMEMKRRQGSNNRGKHLFTAEFIAADCTRDVLKDKYKEREIDLVSIQFSFHYCFESLSQTRRMIENASHHLRNGGIFIGTTTDSQEIIKRLRKSETNSFGNSVYSIKFDDKFNDTNYKIPIFGAKYDFHLDGVVDCPEFLVYFPVFEDICKEYDLKLIYRKNFGQLFDENKDKRENTQLLNVMNALELYSNDTKNSLIGDNDTDYKHAKQALEAISSDSRSRQLGTLSQSEWECISIYTAFCFRKVCPNDKPSTKRHKTD
ncbi:unnamed protein product, partial [Medioppia subpectinata]